MRLILLMLLLFLPYTALSSVRTDMADDEILEAVFRSQIKHCYEERYPKVFFLSYKEQDLSDEFMNKLNAHESRVRKRSQKFGFKDKETGEDGVLLAIRSINRQSNVKAKVKATCGVALLDAYSYEYQVVLKKGKWVVQNRKLTGIS